MGKGREGGPGGRCIAFNDLASELLCITSAIFCSLEVGLEGSYIKGKEIRSHLLMGKVENNLQPCLKPPCSSCLIRAAVGTECDLAVKPDVVPGTNVYFILMKYATFPVCTEEMEALES